MSARWAKVIAVYPEARAADLVYLDTGARVPRVTVLCDTVSTNTGDLDLPSPTAPPEPYSPTATKDRDVYAAVVSVGGTPAIIGFKVPEVCQMTFKRPNFKVYRHASDVYWTIDDDGNIEVYHPSGTFLRIAESAAHENLTGQDFDRRWKIARNTDKQVHVALTVANGGAVKASLDIDPTGKITATTVSDLDVAVTGNINSSAAAWNHTGPVNITGDLTASGTVAGQTDVLAGPSSISGKGHHHTGVQTGAGNSGGPAN